MKHMMKLIGIIAMAAVVGFGFTACGGDGDGGGGGGLTYSITDTDLHGTWKSDEKIDQYYKYGTLVFTANSITTPDDSQIIIDDIEVIYIVAWKFINEMIPSRFKNLTGPIITFEVEGKKTISCKNGDSTSIGYEYTISGNTLTIKDYQLDGNGSAIFTGTKQQ